MNDMTSNLADSLKNNLQGVDVQQLIAQAETLFVEAGRAKARANALDEKRKRVRSTIYVQFRNLGKSQADCEHLAIADSRYQDIVDECERVNLEAEVLRAKAEAVRMQFEAWRTVESSTRAAMVLK